MQTKWPWFERKFEFNFPPEKLPDIVERLRGTPARIECLLSGLEPEILKKRQDGSWSIQENVGHLADLEPLWIGRARDIMAGQETMRSVDLTNQKTFEANHHFKSLHETQLHFQHLRWSLLELIDDLEPDDYSRSAIHPRLLQPMRIVDLCYFVAEHDDYHLARMAHLKKEFQMAPDF